MLIPAVTWTSEKLEKFCRDLAVITEMIERGETVTQAKVKAIVGVAPLSRK